MKLSTRWLIAVILATLMNSATGFAQAKKKDSKKFKSTVVELTEDAPADWLLKEAKVGIQTLSDKDYYQFSEFPEEMLGSTFIFRGSGHEKKWLDPKTISALKDCTVYVMIRWKEGPKVAVGEVGFNQLEKEGWKEVEGEVGTTFPSGGDWRWKAYKKSVKKGVVILQLKNLNLNNGPALMFFFKE